MGYWPLDETSGTVVTDMSGKGHNGSFNTGTPVWVAGKIGGALRFDGLSSVLVTGAGSEDFTKGHTLAGWFKPSVLAAGKNIILSFGIPYISTHSTGNKGYHSIKVAGVQKNIGGATLLTINNWYFIVGTYDNGTMKVYVNGVLDGTLSVPGAETFTYTDLCIGAHRTLSCSTYRVYGMLDEMRVYNRALSAGEVKAMYDAGK